MLVARVHRHLAGIVLSLVLVSVPPVAWAADVMVFAAVSLKDAFDIVATDWTKQTGNHVKISYAPSAALARQITEGAPADVFASADTEWMEYLQSRNLIRKGSRFDLLGNSLVLIAPADASASFKITPGADLGTFLGDGRLAIGELRSVPAGKYARQALEALGMWSGVEDRLAPAATVRAALALVARGEAKAGIVYATDARTEPKVTVLGEFPSDSHMPITYSVALVASATSPDARDFLEYLRAPAALKTYQALGFRILN